MEQAAARASGPQPVVFRDGLGARRRIGRAGETIDVLCLRHDLTEVPAFEFSLRERVSRLATFTHPAFSRVRSVERLKDPKRTLAVVSSAVTGVRLSEVLVPSAPRPALELSAALSALQQLLGAVAAFHDQNAQTAHGAIAADRLVIDPGGQLLVADHVFGSALEQLRYSHDRYWSELKIAIPRLTGAPSLDRRADLLQIGIVALELIRGHVLSATEYPTGLAGALSAARARSPRGDLEPIPTALRAWLEHALLLDGRTGFASADDAQGELDSAIAKCERTPSRAALASSLTGVHSEPVVAAAPPTSVALPGLPNGGPSVETTPTVPHVEPSPKIARDTVTPSPTIEFGLTQLGRPEPFTPFSPIDEADETDDASFDEPQPVDQLRRGFMAKMPWRLRPIAAVGALAVIGLALGGAFLVRARRTPALPPTSTGTVTVNTNPSSVELIVDGQPRGQTPATISLVSGQHRIEVGSGSDTRALPIVVRPGEQLSEYIELTQAPGATAATTGNLDIRTDPPGVPVKIDNEPRGTSPVTVTSLTPGEHSVTLGAGTAPGGKQTVRIEAGATASLVVNMPAPAASAAPPAPPVPSGTIRVSAPAPVQLLEGGQLVGTSGSDRITLPAGPHDLDIVNTDVAFHVTRHVQIQANKMLVLKIDFPKGTIALNAVPWADVWIDGEKVGETPIGNLAIALGRHDVTFRHPDLGEQRQTVNVTMTAAARVSVDMRAR